MFIIGIEGGYGQGKTLTAVVKAHQWAAATGAQVWANFPLRGAYLFDHYEDWYRIADAHGSIIIFDESQSNFDSRTWSAGGQVVMTQVLNYVRKLNCVLIFIAPSYQNVDTRIRDKTDILISCHRMPGGTIYNFVFDYQNKAYGPKGKFLTRWRLPLESQKKIHALRMYNTHSMVARFPTPPAQKVQQFFKELDRRHQAALARVYGNNYLDIETLPKEDLADVG